ncbi:DUF4157 domain-containing protein [Aureisphaera galaxeae]|uniref:eCIS core domain-containing protein n=1 Tax=Aureisphaera galaxeae TaxID=1538023 RepID=UPI00234FF6AA|nr:DUF4157 domain-containing protein [Aureisphaera galaxeae]MDC8005365.1 DUF4157 domain-containing protein [Aureisphaera galaxeae]
MLAIETISRYSASSPSSQTKKGGFIKGLPVQRKLSIGASNDAYEVEADRVADKVVGVSSGQVNVSSQTGALVQRKCTDCEKEEGIQMKATSQTGAGGTASSALTQQIQNNRGGGNAMDASTQNFMESRFGANFSGVKIHTDSQAIQMSRELNAQAFTVGNDIYFNAGKYNPNSISGKHLLAHELTHTIQQGGKAMGIQKAADTGDPIHDHLEEQFRRDRGIPEGHPVSHHGREYGSWLSDSVAALNAFDSFQLRPHHLRIQSVRDRFQRMTLDQLHQYRENYIISGANITQVVNHIASIMLGRPLQPCTTAEQRTTEQKARRALGQMPSILNKADRAMTRLHSAWINHKADLLRGTRRLTGQVPCAFRSNFNVKETDADFGVAHIRVMFRLRRLRGRLRHPVAFTCEAINNPICLSGQGLDSDGYVVNHRSPIHLCQGFRSSVDQNHQTALIIHEFFHLIPGVRDQGGYSQFGTNAMSCTTGSKFSATMNDLVGSADSLAGFLMHIEQTNPNDIRVR